MPKEENTAILVGGGIGGLAAAVALTQSGWKVQVFEQSPRIEEVGAGIQISPNGMRALDYLGVTDALEPAFFEPDYIAMRLGRSRQQIFRIDMKEIAQRRWGHRFVQVHRGDLQAALHARLEDIAGPVVHTDHQVTGFVRERGGASVYLNGEDRVFGNVVIAADGVHSVLRSQMAGADRARFTGHVAWRCIVPVAKLKSSDVPSGTTIWAGERRHALTTRIKGGDVVNFVAIVEQDGWAEEGWSIPGDRNEALKIFDGWDPFLIDILKNADAINRWALFTRSPLATWRDGPVALLGDAAHPMMPSMAQGAVQALEDAVALGRLLKPGEPVEEALAAYEAERKPRATKVQRRSAQNLALFHKKGTLAKLAFFGPLALAGRVMPSLIHRQQDWIYDFDPTA